MIEFLFALDKTILSFCNGTLSNPLFDRLMPILTDLNKHWFGLVAFAALWILLVWKGGRKGRIVGFLLIPLIVLSDQISSSVIKNLIERPRPCHEVDGVRVMEHLRLLVDCGSGFSFPSSHAVNNFAAATFLSYYYRRWTWAFMTYAVLVAFSRMYVGVHFPSDVLGGAVIGALCAAIIIGLWKFVEAGFPSMTISHRRDPAA